MSRPVISVENVSKAYRIGLREETPNSLIQLTMGWLTAPLRNWRQLGRLNTFNSQTANQNRAAADQLEDEDLFWALRDVSFEVQEGEAIGIIGHNGAGKSTLLKILSRITEPSSGCARLRGRVSSLLEVGTGFHPELSGRENIYMNGTILGMTKREIERKFDEIVAFSGVDKFLDTPVKRYSSGMSVRLAFAVAAHLEPEVLIIDEVLAVGDAEFQSKCLGKMQAVAGEGRTVLFVSHNMAAVESLCTKAMLMSRGGILANGDVGHIITAYLARSQLNGTDVDLTDHPDRPASRQAIARRLRILNTDGEPLTAVRVGDDAVLELTLHSDESFAQAAVFIDVEGLRGERLLTFSTAIQHTSPLRLAGTAILECIWRNCRLAPGRYGMSVRVKNAGIEIDSVSRCMDLTVVAADVYGTGRLPHVQHGPFVPEAEWAFRCADLAG